MPASFADERENKWQDDSLRWRFFSLLLSTFDGNGSLSAVTAKIEIG